VDLFAPELGVPPWNSREKTAVNCQWGFLTVDFRLPAHQRSKTFLAIGDDNVERTQALYILSTALGVDQNLETPVDHAPEGHRLRIQ
jgi:hypothetical protein